MSSTDRRERLVIAGAAVVLLLSLAYVLLFLGRLGGGLLAIVWVVVTFVALYLFWRLVRAHERIAAALE